MGLPAKSPQAILWGPRKEGEQYSHVRGRKPRKLARARNTLRAGVVQYLVNDVRI